MFWSLLIFFFQKLFGVELQAVADVWRTSLASGVAPTVNGGGSEDNCLLIQGLFVLFYFILFYFIFFLAF